MVASDVGLVVLEGNNPGYRQPPRQTLSRAQSTTEKRQSERDVFAIRQVISATITDALSGLNPNPASAMTIDDLEVSPSFDPMTGFLSFSPNVDWETGVHHVAITVRDVAGNTASTAWDFNKALLNATATTVTTPLSTVTVGSDRVARFGSITALMSAFNATITGASANGTGVLRRSATFGQFSVTFQNQASSVSVQRDGFSLNFDQQVAVLAGDTRSQTAFIPSKRVPLPAIEITAPSGFVWESGSQASIAPNYAQAVSGPAPVGVFPSASLPASCSGVTCTLEGLLTCKLNVAGTAAASACNGTWPSVVLTMAGTPVRAFPTFGNPEPFQTASEAEQKSTTWAKSGSTDVSVGH